MTQTAADELCPIETEGREYVDLSPASWQVPSRGQRVTIERSLERGRGE